jgi:hypothetical protein
MSGNTALISEMAVLVGIFLLGFVAKMFPKKAGGNRDQGQGTRTENSTQR